jgi:hypothetical protein
VTRDGRTLSVTQSTSKRISDPPSPRLRPMAQRSAPLIVAGALGGGAQGDASVPRRARQGDRYDKACFARCLGHVHEHSVVERF